MNNFWPGANYVISYRFRGSNFYEASAESLEDAIEWIKNTKHSHPRENHVIEEWTWTPDPVRKWLTLHTKEIGYEL